MPSSDLGGRLSCSKGASCGNRNGSRWGVGKVNLGDSDVVKDGGLVGPSSSNEPETPYLRQTPPG